MLCPKDTYFRISTYLDQKNGDKKNRVHDKDLAARNSWAERERKLIIIIFFLFITVFI
jgi:hypothetical protein